MDSNGDSKNKLEPQFYSFGNAEDVISRVYTVSLRKSLNFYLDKLLHHGSVTKNIEDMRRVDGELCLTFRETGRKIVLLADNGFWKQTL